MRVTPAKIARVFSVVLTCGLALGLAPACGGATPRPAARVKLTPKEIVQRSSPGVVRVEAGSDRVGTGFVVDARGVIATNLHVVVGRSDLRVVLYGGATAQVTRIAGIDAEHDLALLGIEVTKPLQALALGNSDVMAAGDPVVAIGNPLGVLDYSVSNGLLSSVRKVGDDSVLVMSAPISQGSSGGPLFNEYGEVVGVTTAIITGGQNLNIAVPIRYLRTLLQAPIEMSLQEFVAATRGESSPRIVRRVPELDAGIFNGCSRPQVLEIVESISSAISSGAPVYNEGNHEACFRIYEGTAVKIEREAACAGARGAFGDGLLRAGSLTSFTEKAWAMRDTFDGVLRAAEEWGRTQPGGPPRTP